MFHGTHPDVLLHHLAYSYIVAWTKSVKMNTSLAPRPKEEKGPGLSHSHMYVLNLTDCSSVGGCMLAK